MPAERRQRWLHHLGVAGGLALLCGWFWIGRSSGIMDWMIRLPLLLAIMVWMIPALLLWKHYNRWLERRLQITGRYLEDEVYLPPTRKD